MKTAHDCTEGCSHFKQLIHAYIDNEIAEIERFRLLKHASTCSDCKTEMIELQGIRKMLGGLAENCVKSEFDFKLKSCLHKEQLKMRNPLYRMQLYVSDNAVSFISIPVVAAVVVTAIMVQTTFQNGPSVTSVVANNSSSNPSTELHLQLPPESSEESVQYVLDSMNSQEADKGIFLETSINRSPASSTANTATLVHF